MAPRLRIAAIEPGAAPPPVRKVLIPPPTWPPTLVVVIDTEEEFAWDAGFDPAATSVANIGFQHLAQAVLDAHGIVPTYMVDYPVASTPAAVSVLRAYKAEGRCEIGAHLHPWVNPPTAGPTDARSSYPGNLPAALEQQKLIVLTDTISENFGNRPTVYKAGRYGLGAATPTILRELGYSVDVSVVPYTNFSSDGGPDFSHVPANPAMIDESLLEIPLSVHFVGTLAALGPRLFPRLLTPAARRLRLAGLLARLSLLERLRLSPEGHTLEDLIRQTGAALAAGVRVFMLTYHSSSLLPGATGYVRSEEERDAFLTKIDGYLQFFLDKIDGRASTVTRVATELASQET